MILCSLQMAGSPGMLSGLLVRVHLNFHYAYSNILNILPPKTENFQIKNSYILHISVQNIDCGYPLELPRWGSSNTYTQSMFLYKKNNGYPCKPQFYYIKVGFKGIKIIQACFRDTYMYLNLRCIFWGGLSFQLKSIGIFSYFLTTWGNWRQGNDMCMLLQHDDKSHSRKCKMDLVWEGVNWTWKNWDSTDPTFLITL